MKGMDLDLAGQTVLITGASKGIGLATARAFAAEGCHLHLAACTAGDLETARATIQRDSTVNVIVDAQSIAKEPYRCGAPVLSIAAVAMVGMA